MDYTLIEFPNFMCCFFVGLWMGNILLKISTVQSNLFFCDSCWSSRYEISAGTKQKVLKMSYPLDTEHSSVHIILFRSQFISSILFSPPCLFVLSWSRHSMFSHILSIKRDLKLDSTQTVLISKLFLINIYLLFVWFEFKVSSNMMKIKYS